MKIPFTCSGTIKIGNTAGPVTARVTTERGSFVVTRCKIMNGSEAGADAEVWAPGEIGADGFTLSFKDLPVFLKRHNKGADGKPMYPGYRSIQIHAPNAGAFRRVEG